MLYAFTGQADGEEPFAGLLRDGNGNLYGTTQYGGDLGSQQGYCSGLGCGVVFKLSACHTALCHGEDDADTATATTNRATVTQHPSTAASANPALRDRRFPGNRPRPRNRTNKLVRSTIKGCIRMCTPSRFRFFQLAPMATSNLRLCCRASHANSSFRPISGGKAGCFPTSVGEVSPSLN